MGCLGCGRRCDVVVLGFGQVVLGFAGWQCADERQQRALVAGVRARVLEIRDADAARRAGAHAADHLRPIGDDAHAGSEPRWPAVVDLAERRAGLGQRLGLGVLRGPGRLSAPAGHASPLRRIGALEEQHGHRPDRLAGLHQGPRRCNGVGETGRRAGVGSPHRVLERRGELRLGSAEPCYRSSPQWGERALGRSGRHLPGRGESGFALHQTCRQ
mmetsp:Transcript_45359/g.115185  ORF Transcript_45359/g.115185 Transcript_45359/m.115185 type:complete len:215 (+) Transcript_45359:277-921(+)